MSTTSPQTVSSQQVIHSKVAASLTTLGAILHASCHVPELRTTTQAFGGRIGIGQDGLVLPDPLADPFTARVSAMS